MSFSVNNTTVNRKQQKKLTIALKSEQYQNNKQYWHLLPVGSVEICTQASCVCGMPQTHHRLFRGPLVSPCQALVHPKTAGLCNAQAMQNPIISLLFHKLASEKNKNKN